MQYKGMKNLEIKVQDRNTGEIYDTYQTCSPLANIHVSEPTSAERMKYYQNLNDHRAMAKSLGGFIMVLYYNNCILYERDLMSKASVTRLLMLATYMDFENRLVLEVPTTRKQAEEVEYMNRSDIQKVLNLKNTAFKAFMKEVTDSEILIKEGKTYRLSTEFFHKGEIARDMCFSKLYVGTMRELYNSTPAKKHSTLSYIFQLMPLVHWKTNYIVTNRMSGLEDMETLDIAGICAFLGLETSKSGLCNMKKELLSFRIERNGEYYYLFNMMTQTSKNGQRSWFIINPLIYNSMNDYSDFKEAVKATWVN